MAKPRKPTRRRRTREPQFVERLNLLFTQEQFLQLQALAREERRPLPNMCRLLLDLGLAHFKQRN